MKLIRQLGYIIFGVIITGGEQLSAQQFEAPVNLTFQQALNYLETDSEVVQKKWI